MSKRNKWIIAAVVLLVTGMLLCGVSYAALGFDFGKLSTTEYVTNTYDVKENFQNIDIKADTEKITFIRSEDDTCKVVCLEEKEEPHQVVVQNDTLTIEPQSRKSWSLFHLNLTSESPEITVYLPDDTYQELSVDADTGHVTIPEAFTFDSIHVILSTGDIDCLASAKNNISFKTDTGHITVTDVTTAGMDLTSDTGRMELSGLDISGDLMVKESTGSVTMEHVTCSNLTSDGSTGKLTLTDVLARGEFRLERDTGNIEFDGCDAEAIYVKTATGNVTGTLLSDKVFLTDTDTGSVDVPKTISGGRCEITTDTGDIRISVR